MERRQFLRLGAVASGVFALGGISRVARGTGAAQTLGVPTVERLVMTNVVDNVYDAFARGGKLDTITVQRAALDPKGLLLFEHGLAYHLESVRGGERREILLDFSATQGTLLDRKSTRLNSSHGYISYAVFCLKKKKTPNVSPSRTA